MDIALKICKITRSRIRRYHNLFQKLGQTSAAPKDSVGQSMRCQKSGKARKVQLRVFASYLPETCHRTRNAEALKAKNRTFH